MKISVCKHFQYLNNTELSKAIEAQLQRKQLCVEATLRGCLLTLRLEEFSSHGNGFRLYRIYGGVSRIRRLATKGYDEVEAFWLPGRLPLPEDYPPLKHPPQLKRSPSHDSKKPR